MYCKACTCELLGWYELVGGAWLLPENPVTMLPYVESILNLWYKYCYMNLKSLYKDGSVINTSQFYHKLYILR